MFLSIWQQRMWNSCTSCPTPCTSCPTPCTLAHGNSKNEIIQKKYEITKNKKISREEKSEYEKKRIRNTKNMKWKQYEIIKNNKISREEWIREEVNLTETRRSESLPDEIKKPKRPNYTWGLPSPRGRYSQKQWIN